MAGRIVRLVCVLEGGRIDGEAARHMTEITKPADRGPERIGCLWLGWQGVLFLIAPLLFPSFEVQAAVVYSQPATGAFTLLTAGPPVCRAVGCDCLPS